MKAAILCVACLFLGMHISSAQNKSVGDTFREYITELNGLSKNRDITRVVRYFDRDYVFTETYIGLTGRSSRVEGKISDFRNSIKGILSEENVQLNLKIEKLNEIAQDEIYGTISATLSVDLVVDGKQLEKNGFNVTMTAIKNKLGKWRFIQGDIVRKLEKREAGNCVCYFYERNDDFVTELIYPIGFDYRRILDDFKFRGDKNDRYIKTGYRQFAWDKDGAIKEIYLEEGEKPSVGLADEKKEAIMVILNNIYSDECISIISR